MCVGCVSVCRVCECVVRECGSVWEGKGGVV